MKATVFSAMVFFRKRGFFSGSGVLTGAFLAAVFLGAAAFFAAVFLEAASFFAGAFAPAFFAFASASFAMGFPPFGKSQIGVCRAAWAAQCKM
ncbi:MAG: hypothetical protein E7431_09630 [Ruminococcaceae bacterium]|nr:hypothetical protein [Oscillospiraceae bacterium]